MSRGYKVQTVDDGLSYDDLCAIAEINPRRVDFLLQTRAIRASVAPSRGRGHHNRFSLVDALVACVFNALSEAGTSPRRIHQAIGTELYAIAEQFTRYARGAKQADGAPVIARFLLIIEPRSGGRMWHCDLCYPVGPSWDVTPVKIEGTTAVVPAEVPRPILPPGVAEFDQTIPIPAFTNARSHRMVFAIGALWRDLHQALEARIDADRRRARSA